MTKTDASTKPEIAGWYVCWLHLTERPVVLWWGAFSEDWRAGPMRVSVTHWMGPLPK